MEAHLKQQVAQAADALKREARERSRIRVDEAERLAARAEGEKIVREMWDMNGLPLDQMTDEQAQELLGFPSARAYMDWFSGLSEDDLSCAALGYALLEAEGNVPTEADWREARRKMTEDEGVPEEQLKDYTFPAYVRQQCSEYYHDTLEQYAYQIIKERLS